jgi:hypothetical protein
MLSSKGDLLLVKMLLHRPDENVAEQRLEDSLRGNTRRGWASPVNDLQMRVCRLGPWTIQGKSA